MSTYINILQIYRFITSIHIFILYHYIFTDIHCICIYNDRYIYANINTKDIYCVFSYTHIYHICMHCVSGGMLVHF